MGLDIKTYWLTDRQLQCDFDFNSRPVLSSEMAPPKNKTVTVKQ
jgi:hypothetical protein